MKDKKKTILLIISILLLYISFCTGMIIGLVTTNKNNIKNNDVRNVTRTLMIYMAGSDLESGSGLGSYELESIVPENTNLEDLNVILLAGGSKKWHNDFISENETSIFELTSDGFKKIKQNDVKNMGESQTLSEFLNYVYENYKTDEYDLLFWNHGGAVDGNEYDELNSSDNLSLLEVKEAFTSSPFKNKKLELVIYRTCLNGTIEYANILKDYANYMVASEEVTVGMQGYSPLTFISKINKETSTVDIGKMMINTYKEAVDGICNGSKDCVNITYSIIDLSKINDINYEMNNFFGNLKKDLSTNFASISRIRDNIPQYGSDIKEYDMIDLYYLVDNLSNYGNGEVLKSKIKNAIVYNYTNNNYSNGLSIYFPYNSTYFTSIYKDISSSNSYYDFITDFSKERNTIKTPLFSLNDIKKENQTNEGADFELELTDEQVENYSSAKAIVFLKNKNKEDRVGMYRPLFNTKDIKLNGNKLQTKIRGKSLRAVDNSTSEGGWLTLIETYHEDDVYRYQTFGILENINGKFAVESVELSIEISNKNPNGKIINAKIRDKSNTDKGKILPNVVSKNYLDYDYIAFASSSYDLEFNEDGTYKDLGKSDGIIEGYEFKTKELKFIKENFENDNEYYAVFVITDVAGNTYNSKLIKIN